jgi:protein-S-isoprenylcysteine O-methyltransferase Ste14
MLFIGIEEKQLTQTLGKHYEDYMARVDRLVPFKKPLTHCLVSLSTRQI